LQLFYGDKFKTEQILKFTNLKILNIFKIWKNSNLNKFWTWVFSNLNNFWILTNFESEFFLNQSKKKLV
jgi:hypothetical protein